MLRELPIIEPGKLSEEIGGQGLHDRMFIRRGVQARRMAPPRVEDDREREHRG